MIGIQTINPRSEVGSCKYCQSTNIRKYGFYKGVQRYFCDDCKRKFKADNTLFHMKTSPEQISSALRMYYSGMSIKDIKGLLRQEHNNDPSKKTIFEWIDKYSDLAVKTARDYKPQKTGTKWIADETVLRIGGQNVWMYDIIDADTRFLLATRITTSRTTKDAELLMLDAEKHAGITPREVLTDANRSYDDGIELAFGGDTEHIKTRPFAEGDNTQLIERWHETLKERTKVMKGLKTIDSANQFIAGFLVDYNYFRPHESLDGKTPAQETGIKFPYANWAEIIRQPVSKDTEIATHETPKIKLPKTKYKMSPTRVGRPRKHNRQRGNESLSLGAVRG